jgi:hypothetical protein
MVLSHFRGFGEAGTAVIQGQTLQLMHNSVQAAVRADANGVTGGGDGLPPQAKVIQVIPLAGQKLLKKMWPRFFDQVGIHGVTAKGTFCEARQMCCSWVHDYHPVCSG